MKKSEYTQEFKDSTIQLAINSEESTSKIAKDLGMNKQTLYSWISDYKKDHSSSSQGTDKKSIPKETFEEEAKRLRAENKVLKQERDILKKATAPQGHFFQGTTSQKKFSKVRLDQTK
jgi:transposase